MIPITLITGFLGSGKTTLLSCLADQHRDRRIAWLVNEFSPIDVDGRLAWADGREVVRVPGGSIFCQCLVTSFIQHLRQIAQWSAQADGPFEALVIEASGIADPRVTGRMLTETQLDQSYRLARIVSVVDPGTFGKLLHTLPNIAAQIEASDLVAINKVDLYSEGEVQATEAAVHAIRPEVRTERTTHGQVNLDLTAGEPHQALEGSLARSADPRFQQAYALLHAGLDRPAFEKALGEMAGRLYRLKGFIHDRQGERWHVDLSSSGIRWTSARPEPGPGELVAIFPPTERAAVEAWLAGLEPVQGRSLPLMS